MDVGELIYLARSENRLSLRQLALRAGTSHSTLSTYESGRKVPSVQTLQRILDAAGYQLTLDLRRKPLEFDPVQRGQELADLIDLAAHFPSSHPPRLPERMFRRA